MRFYVASGLQNRALAKNVIDYLLGLGHLVTYDWTVHGDVRESGEDVLTAVSLSETRAVCDAELVIVLLPGGCGTHTELGIAIASRTNKRIIVWSETGKEYLGGPDTCVFYHHPVLERISCPASQIGERIKLLLMGKFE